MWFVTLSTEGGDPVKRRTESAKDNVPGPVLVRTVTEVRAGSNNNKNPLFNHTGVSPGASPPARD